MIHEWGTPSAKCVRPLLQMLVAMKRMLASDELCDDILQSQRRPQQPFVLFLRS
jgi:hypothetical protein